ncbi:c-type heme family protein [Aquimarina sp. 433]
MNHLKTKGFFFSMLSSIIFLTQSCGGVPEETSLENGPSDKVFAVADILTLVAEENDITRTLYTKGIVGAGKKQGLKFDEDWQDDEVEAGPLPALFLRGISSDIRKSDVPLGLYLGSDFPINASNKFQGKQAELFKKIKANQKPQHFYEEDQKLYTSMFADLAVAAPCVNCHNDHKSTTKTDWKLGDVMGATTWQYPSDSLSYKEAIGVINAYRNGTKAIYNAYLEEIAAFKVDSTKPQIGNQWPSKGFYLPTAEVFIDSVRKLASYHSLEKLLLADTDKNKTTEGLAAN